MKTNVDLVNLIAIQELADVSLPALTDYLNIGKSTDLLGKRISINSLAALISSALGSGSLIPERRYLIDSDMPSGATYEINGDGNGQINDPYLDGKVYDLHRNGLLISKGVIWDNDVSGGGFRLLTPGDTFEIGEEIVASFQPSFSPYIPTPDAIARFTNGEQIISATSTITSGMYRKLIVLQSSTNVLTVTLPSASDYPANVLLAIISNGGSHKQATLRCAGSDVINFAGTTWADFWIRQNQQIFLLTTSNGWRVVHFSGSEHFNRLGVTDLGCIVGPNHWNAATNPGPQLRSVYPGTWNFIQRLKVAQPSAVVSGAAWVSNPTMWGEGDGSTTFNFPYKGGYFPRYLDPDGNIDEDRFNDGTGNLPNSTQDPALQSHIHTGLEADNTAHDSSSLPHGAPQKLLVNIDNRGRNGHGVVQGAKIGSNDNASYETRPYNIGELPLINI